MKRHVGSGGDLGVAPAKFPLMGRREIMRRENLDRFRLLTKTQEGNVFQSDVAPRAAGGLNPPNRLTRRR